MEWAEAINEAIRFMESYITDNITMYDVAEHVSLSPFYFHKGFSLLCGFHNRVYKKPQDIAGRGRVAHQ